MNFAQKAARPEMASWTVGTGVGEWRRRTASDLALYARFARDPTVWAVAVVLGGVLAALDAVHSVLALRGAGVSADVALIAGVGMGVTSTASWWVVYVTSFALTALVPLSRRSWIPGVLGLLVVATAMIVLRYALMVELWLLLGWTRPHDIGPIILKSLSGQLLGVTAWMGAGYGAAHSLRQQEEALVLSRRERELADARFQSLRSRLDPEFLLHAFDGLATRMRTDIRAADRFLLRFSELLRVAYRPEAGEDASLDDELELLRLYADVQGRGADSLRIRVRCPGDTEAVVPRMSVLPVVAAMLRRASAGDEVKVAAVADGTGLRLELRGPDPRGAESVELLNQALADRFGPAHRWVIEDLPAGRVSATLSLPALPWKGDHE